MTGHVSGPVWGVEIKKAVVAARVAPWRRSEADTGITPQLHSGSGTPKAEAFSTDQNPRRPRCRSISLGGISTLSSPATKKPNSR